MNLPGGYGLAIYCILLVSCGGGDGGGTEPKNETVTEVELGKLIFEDTRLSANGNQSCASCHAAGAGFADPDVTQAAPVSEGSIADRFGNRNAPSSAYAGFSPPFGTTTDLGGNPVYVGGQFLDGRRDSLEDQAKDPFLNMDEMANANKQAVVSKVRTGPYADKFKQIFGANAFNNTISAYDNIAHAIASFERSAEMNQFNSKFDCYLKDAEQYALTKEELDGLTAFDKAGKCSSCHRLVPQTVTNKVLLTNFQYFNIGVPKNPDNPDTAVDYGLGGRLGIAAERGKFKTPGLRNIALTAPYMHNGVFTTLEEVMAFYNIPQKQFADVPPEVNANISTDVDFLELSEQQISDIIAFMKTLTDGTGVGVCF